MRWWQRRRERHQERTTRRGRRRLAPRRWQPGAPVGDVLADVHVPPPPPNRDNPDAVLADVWEEVPARLRVAEAEELADDIRRLRSTS